MVSWALCGGRGTYVEVVESWLVLCHYVGVWYRVLGYMKEDGRRRRDIHLLGDRPKD